MKDLRINVTEQNVDNILKKLYAARLQWRGGGQDKCPSKYPCQIIVENNILSFSGKAFNDENYSDIPEVDTIPPELKITMERSDVNIAGLSRVCRYTLNDVSVLVCDDADQIVKIQQNGSVRDLATFKDKCVIEFAMALATAKPGELIIPEGDTVIREFLKATKCL